MLARRAESARRGRGDCVQHQGEQSEALIDDGLVDQIAAGLLGRYYGTVADPAGIATTSPLAEPPADTTVDGGGGELVIDLRGPRPRLSRRRDLRARWRAFRAYWWGHTASNVGDHLTLIALPLAADHLTKSAFAVGAIVFAETLATVLLGGITGVIADRRPSRRLMVAVDVTRAALLVGLCVVVQMDRFPVAVLIAASFVLGVLRLLFDGAQSSFIARLVPDELDLRSNNRLVLAENIGLTVGPVLAGITIDVGLSLAFGIDALTFVFSTAALLAAGRALRISGITIAPSAAATQETPPRWWSDVRSSYGLLREHPTFRRALVCAALFNVCALPIGQQFVTIARERLGLGASGIGLLFAVGGIAGIVAAPLVERDNRIRPVVLPIATGALGGAVLAVGVAPSLFTASLAFIVGGVAFAFLMTHWAALRQRLFAPEVQGRVALTARGVMWSAILVGALATGALSDAVSPEAMWIACGSIGLATCLWGFATGAAAADL